MCFDLDSSPPVSATEGTGAEHEPLVLTSADGNRFRAFHARPGRPTGKAILILPDVRGLHHYYEELALRFAENGVEAVAMDYFGRSAGTSERDATFDYNPHVAQTTWDGLSADIVASAAFLREHAQKAPESAAPNLFTIGFCMGGRNAFLSSTLGLGLSGAIGFYGFPGGPARNDTPAPMDVVEDVECPILGIFGGADQAIPVPVVQSYRDALSGAGVENEIVVEPDAPHSFFDRKAADFQVQSDDAWSRVRRFIDAHGVA